MLMGRCDYIRRKKFAPFGDSERLNSNIEWCWPRGMGAKGNWKVLAYRGRKTRRIFEIPTIPYGRADLRNVDTLAARLDACGGPAKYDLLVKTSRIIEERSFRTVRALLGIVSEMKSAASPNGERLEKSVWCGVAYRYSAMTHFPIIRVNFSSAAFYDVRRRYPYVERTYGRRYAYTPAHSYRWYWRGGDKRIRWSFASLVRSWSPRCPATPNSSRYLFARRPVPVPCCFYFVMTSLNSRLPLLARLPVLTVDLYTPPHQIPYFFWPLVRRSSAARTDALIRNPGITSFNTAFRPAPPHRYMFSRRSRTVIAAESRAALHSPLGVVFFSFATRFARFFERSARWIFSGARLYFLEFIRERTSIPWAWRNRDLAVSVMEMRGENPPESRYRAACFIDSLGVRWTAKAIAFRRDFFASAVLPKV